MLKTRLKAQELAEQARKMNHLESKHDSGWVSGHRLRNTGGGKTAGCTFQCKPRQAHARDGIHMIDSTFLQKTRRSLKVLPALHFQDFKTHHQHKGSELVANRVIQHSDFTNENQHNQHYWWNQLNSELPCFSGISEAHNGSWNIFFSLWLNFLYHPHHQGAPRNNSKHACMRVTQLLKC